MLHFSGKLGVMGLWGPWSECTKECHVRRTRHKSYDDPPPTAGFMRAGRFEDYVLCRYGLEFVKLTHKRLR